MNAQECYDKAIDILCRTVSQGRIDDLVKWSAQNRDTLLESYYYFEQASKLLPSDDQRWRSILLGNMSHLCFYLLDDNGAIKFANQSLAIDPFQMESAYVLFLIAFNAYINKKRSVVVYGGAVGIILNTRKFFIERGFRGQLEMATSTLLASARHVLDDHDPGAWISNKINTADWLIDSAKMLADIGMPNRDLYQAVLLLKLSLGLGGQNIDEEIQRCLALALGNLRFH